VVVATILVSIVCFLGFIACIAPGVIFAIWFALTSQSIVIERLGPVAGMSRSKQLVSGNLGKVFGTTFIAGLIASLASGLFQVIGALLTGGIGPSTTVTAATIRELFSLAGQALGMPISASVAILLYYDLRIRKEGFDLQMLAQTLGTQGMPADGQPPVQY
jgi:hypothetical protein